MENAISQMFGIRYPIFGFSHSREVVAAVSRAGGFGVYGAATFSPERVDADLDWIARHCDGCPFGVDVMFPLVSEGKGDNEIADLEAALERAIPPEHRRFVASLLERFGIPGGPLPALAPTDRPGGPGWRSSWNDFKLGAVESGALLLLEVALRHPISLIVTALGPPTPALVNSARERGIRLGALVGRVDHARKHVDAGVDLIVAQGWEAAAHTGEISTLVLVPEIVEAVTPIPVLAAGGIATGRQAAAATALGAQGIWTGSIWLTTEESDEPPAVIERLLKAGSSDTIRSRCRTGKPLRQLNSEWALAWESKEAPGILSMPTQHLLTADAEERFHRFGRADLTTIPVGQAVGLTNSVKSAAEVINKLVTEWEHTLLQSPRRLGLT